MKNIHYCVHVKHERYPDKFKDLSNDSGNVVYEENIEQQQQQQKGNRGAIAQGMLTLLRKASIYTKWLFLKWNYVH